MCKSIGSTNVMRLLGSTVAAAAFFVLTGQAIAAEEKNWPQQPITLVIPFAPGGSADTLGRVLAEEMAPKLGRPVVVENKPGAGTTVASAYVARAKPDGYTLYIGMMNLHGMDKELYPDVKYDGIEDFTHINRLVSFPMVVVTRAESDVVNFNDLIEKANIKPDNVTHASAGVGSSNHVAAVQFMQIAGVKLLNVPFKGGNPAAVATIAGDVDVSFATPPTAMPLIHAGRLKALGLSSAEPSLLFPGIPSAAEAGLPGYDFKVWHGLYGPANMDPVIVQQLFDVTTEILADSKVQDRLHGLGMEEQPSTSVAEFNQFVREVGSSTADLARAARDDQ